MEYYSLEECLERCIGQTKKLYDCLAEDQADIRDCLGGNLLSAYENFIRCALEQTDRMRKEQEKIQAEERSRNRIL